MNKRPLPADYERGEMINMSPYISDESLRFQLASMLLREEKLRESINNYYDEGLRRGLWDDGYDKQSNIDKD